jgi:hypothetical protein
MYMVVTKGIRVSCGQAGQTKIKMSTVLVRLSVIVLFTAAARSDRLHILNLFGGPRLHEDTDSEKESSGEDSLAEQEEEIEELEDGEVKLEEGKPRLAHF